MEDQLKVRALALIAKWKTPGANTSLNRASSLAEAHKILDQLQIQNQLLDRAANWFSQRFNRTKRSGMVGAMATRL